MDVTEPDSAEEIIRTVLEEVANQDWDFDTDVATDNVVAALRRHGYLPPED